MKTWTEASTKLPLVCLNLFISFLSGHFAPSHYLITHQLNITSYRCDLKNHGKNKDDGEAHDIFCKINLTTRKDSAQHADSGFPWNLEPGVCIHTRTYAPTAALAKKILRTDYNQDSPRIGDNHDFPQFIHQHEQIAQCRFQLS